MHPGGACPFLVSRTTVLIFASADRDVTLRSQALRQSRRLAEYPKGRRWRSALLAAAYDVSGARPVVNHGGDDVLEAKLHEPLPHGFEALRLIELG